MLSRRVYRYAARRSTAASIRSVTPHTAHHHGRCPAAHAHARAAVLPFHGLSPTPRSVCAEGAQQDKTGAPRIARCRCRQRKRLVAYAHVAAPAAAQAEGHTAQVRPPAANAFFLFFLHASAV